MKFSSIRLLSLMVLAFIFTIISLPEQLSIFRPLWVLLLMLYLQFMLPNVFHLSMVILFGLTLDALGASPMGQHAFALALVAWCASGRARRFKFFSMPQQIVWVFVLCLIYQLTLCLINYILGYPFSLWNLIIPISMSTLIWLPTRQCAEHWLSERSFSRR